MYGSPRVNVTSSHIGSLLKLRNSAISLDIFYPDAAALSQASARLLDAAE
jgi:hypothetical protein